MNIEENWEAGLDPATGKPGPRGGKSATPGSGALGTVRDDVTVPWMHGRLRSSRPRRLLQDAARGVSRAPRDLSGRPSRRRRPSRSAGASSTRRSTPSATSGTSPEIPRIRTTAASGSITTAVTAPGHRPSLVTAALWFKGLIGASVFAPANRARPWYQGRPGTCAWTMSSPRSEAEQSKDASGRRCTWPRSAARSSASIRRPALVTLVSSGDPAPAVYFPVGESRRVLGVAAGRMSWRSTSASTLRALDGRTSFDPGDTVTWRQPSGFPLTDVRVLLRLLRAGAVPRRLPVPRGRGRLAHGQRARWCGPRAAMRRGITATAGAIDRALVGRPALHGEARSPP